MLHVEVARDQLDRTRVAEEDLPAPADGEVLLAVAAFGFTANNITYATLADDLGYWTFFPADPGWGRIPVWGFADVLSSTVPEVAPGARVFGYLPMSTHLVVRPALTRGGFVDESPHRRDLPATYNQYRLTADDPLYDPAREAQRMLLWPLFVTSFLLAEQERAGAATVILSSASSRTANAAAFLLHDQGVPTVGLTSPANRDFTQRLGVYDRVVTYPEVGDLPVEPSVYVDLAGSSAVRRTVHQRLGPALRRSTIVGATHRASLAPDADLPGPAPAFFFAPDHLRRRGGLGEDVVRAWHRYLAWTDTWLQIERATGPDAVLTIYRAALAGRLAPSTGHVLSLAS